MANAANKKRLKANQQLLLGWLAAIVGTLLTHVLLHRFVFAPESTGVGILVDESSLSTTKLFLVLLWFCCSLLLC
jgi:hypothetical protein